VRQQVAQELNLSRFESQNGEFLPRQAQEQHKQKEMAVDFDVPCCNREAELPLSFHVECSPAGVRTLYPKHIDEFTSVASRVG
jgi:hypothetical protein